MALILDKSITGVIDTSGTTGYTNLTYETNSGVILDNPYLVIDEITINKYSKYIKITLLLFKDIDSRNNNKYFIENKIYLISNNDEMYDNYFSFNVMENVNIYESAYKYINENIFTKWKSDE